MALGFKDGAVKYGPFNWREHGVAASVYVGAALRHLLDYWDGEELARDSKKPHLAHALACLAILVDATENGTLVDDRPLPGAAPWLMEKWEEKDERPQEGSPEAEVLERWRAFLGSWSVPEEGPEDGGGSEDEKGYDAVLRDVYDSVSPG